MNEATTCKGRIFNIQKYSIYDGQGIRTLVFLKGCPLRCKWCSNPEGISRQYQIMFRQDQCVSCGACVRACPQKIHTFETINDTPVHRIDRSLTCSGCGACAGSCLKGALSVTGREVSVEELVKSIQEDSMFYWSSGGGVTFGGGEATVQSEFLREALKECKKQGIHTAIETCGMTDWPTLQGLMEYVDLFLYDLKHIESAAHKRLTGHGNETILANLEQLFEHHAHIIVRMPLIKGCNDAREDLAKALEYIKRISKDKNLDGVDILPYHKLGINKYKQLGMEYSITEDLSFSDEELAELKEFISRFPLPVRIVKH